MLIYEGVVPKVSVQVTKRALKDVEELDDIMEKHDVFGDGDLEDDFLILAGGPVEIKEKER